MLLLSFMVIKLALLQLLQCCASTLPVQGHGPRGPLAMLACQVITPASLLLLLLSPQLALCHNTGNTWKKHSWWRCRGDNAALHDQHAAAAPLLSLL